VGEEVIEEVEREANTLRAGDGDGVREKETVDVEGNEEVGIDQLGDDDIAARDGDTGVGVVVTGEASAERGEAEAGQAEKEVGTKAEGADEEFRAGLWTRGGDKCGVRDVEIGVDDGRDDGRSDGEDENRLKSET
jgi:hypothetical protein